MRTRFRKLDLSRRLSSRRLSRRRLSSRRPARPVSTAGAAGAAGAVSERRSGAERSPMERGPMRLRHNRCTTDLRCSFPSSSTSSASLSGAPARHYVLQAAPRPEKGSPPTRSIPFLLLPFGSPPLKLPLPGLELIRSAPVGAVRGRGLLKVS